MAGVWSRIDHVEILNFAGFGPDAAMVLGLKAVRGDLFAVLEEDDFWLCGHITSLLTLAETARPGRAYAYSGVLQVEEPAAGDNAAPVERRRVRTLAPLGGDFSDIVTALTIDSFLASSALLRFIDLDDCVTGGAAAAVLQANLIARAEPAISQRATVCVDAQSNGAVSDGYQPEEDAFECLLRLQLVIDRVERKLPKPAIPLSERLRQAMQRIVEAQRLALAGKSGVLALEGGSIITSMYARDDLEPAASPS